MRDIVVDLIIAAEEYQRLYHGTARDVITTATDGRRVRFPARILRPYVLHSGIRGRFRIVFDDRNRF